MGCVFYEMLSGHAPLTQTRDKVARMNRHRFEDIPPIGSYGVELPGAVQTLLSRMMAFDPKARYQTPAQLHEAVRKVQGEMDGIVTHKAAPTGPKSVFIVEAHPKIQDVFREHFSKSGFRPLISADPNRAVHRYEEQPYHALIIDAGTAGEAGLNALKKIVKESDDMDLTIAAVLVLEENQADWVAHVPQHPGVAVLVRPGVTLRTLTEKLSEMLEQSETADA
jgi:CheY-like chemotaxis protein